MFKGKGFILLGISLLYAMALTMFGTFLLAYFNGGKVTIDINHFHEATFEFILFSCIMVIGLVAIILQTKRELNGSADTD